MFWHSELFERLATAAALEPNFRNPEFPPSAVVNSSATVIQRHIMSLSPNGYISVRCYLVTSVLWRQPCLRFGCSSVRFTFAEVTVGNMRNLITFHTIKFNFSWRRRLPLYNLLLAKASGPIFQWWCLQMKNAGQLQTRSTTAVVLSLPRTICGTCYLIHFGVYLSVCYPHHI